MQKRLIIFCFALAVLALPSLASATSITFTSTSGTRSASVTFTELGGGVLQVTLTNTSTYDAMAPTDLLTAVFFDLTDDPTLTKIDAVLAPGSTVLYGDGTDTDPTPLDGVGSEWAYKGGSSVLAFGANEAISSTGVGIFSPTDRFVTTNNLAGPLDPDGPQYGITSAGDDPATYNGGLHVPIIKNSVIFTLGGFNGTLSSTSISNVTFLYGTALTEPTITGFCRAPCGVSTVPEPATLLLVSVGGVAAAARALQRRRRERR